MRTTQATQRRQNRRKTIETDTARNRHLGPPGKEHSGTTSGQTDSDNGDSHRHPATEDERDASSERGRPRHCKGTRTTHESRGNANTSPGAGVDWWVLYKLPARDRHKPSNLDQGVAYVYSTSITSHKGWTLSDLSIEDPGSLPGNTLQPLYNNQNQDLYHVMYNDEHPDGNTSFTDGHTKGVVFGDASNTVWLIHSVPHYPPVPQDGYGYPHTGHLYGQSYLCLSLRTDSANVVGTQLTYNRPYIYSTAVPDWLTDYPAMMEALEGKHIHVAPYFHAAHVKTRAGKRVTTFAKYTDFGKDLYADLVAPMLRVPLLVETWPNGPGRMNSSCRPPFIVENVAEMDFPSVDGEDFTTRHDHAKWAISLDVKKPYVCVGDINRMETQRKRAGGTACFLHKRMWKTFKIAIKGVETCPRPYK